MRFFDHTLRRLHQSSDSLSNPEWVILQLLQVFLYSFQPCCLASDTSQALPELTLYGSPSSLYGLMRYCCSNPKRHFPAWHSRLYTSLGYGA